MILWCASPPEGKPSLDVSINGDDPWNRLSPDYQHGQIPVPGISGMYGESVTGIMESLLLIGKPGKNPKINIGYLTGPGRIREAKEGEIIHGHSFMGKRVGIVSANLDIFIPSYIWVLQNKVYDIVANLKALEEAYGDEDLWVYDGVTGDIPQKEEKLSAAAVLVAYVNDHIEEFAANFQ